MVRAAARRINPNQNMGVVGPQGQIIRNQQPGQRGIQGMQNQQHIMEHEENLSDKELYPGQHGQMVSIDKKKIEFLLNTIHD